MIICPSSGRIVILLRNRLLKIVFLMIKRVGFEILSLIRAPVGRSYPVPPTSVHCCALSAASISNTSLYRQVIPQFYFQVDVHFAWEKKKNG